MSAVFAYFGAIFNILIIVVLASLVARFLRIPYTIALVLGGLLASLIIPFSLPQFSPEIFLTLLLPPIVFQAATHISLSEIRKDGGIILSYAFIGTLLSAFLVGILSYFLLGFTFFEALLLGIIVSPTDSIAIISVLKKLGIAKRLALIIEGESLFNDGVAVVMYSVIIKAISSGFFDAIGFIGEMFLSIVIGVVIGSSIGFIISKFVLLSDDRFIQMILTFLLMYGSYKVATDLNGSGIISVAVAGIVIGDFLAKNVPQKKAEELDIVWEFLAFMVTSISFILIGMDVNISLLSHYIVTIIFSILIVLIIRAVTVGSLTRILNLKKEVVPRSWLNIMVWSGLKGAISVMLALGLGSLGINHADEIVAITFGIVLFSVLFQGLLVRYIIKKPVIPYNEWDNDVTIS